MTKITEDKKNSNNINSPNSSHPKLSNARQIYTSLVAGACAGAVAKTVIAPLDRTKIYFQTHPEKNYRISGAIRFIKLTYTNEGFLSLWRGNTATMARIVPYAAIQFMAHEQYKRLLKLDKPLSVDRKPGFYNFLAGSLAGLTGQSLTYPLDRARAVMAVTKIGEYRNLAEVFRRIVEEEGMRGLYRGFTPTMIGVVFYAGTSFFTYERLKHSWYGQNLHLDDPSPSFLQRLVAGAFAGLCGQSSSYPLDIVRRRMQVANQMGVEANTYSNIKGSLIYIYNREGIRRGWYKGISMNFVKGPIATGISFATFDYFQMGLRKFLFEFWDK